MRMKQCSHPRAVLMTFRIEFFDGDQVLLFHAQSRDDISCKLLISKLTSTQQILMKRGKQRAKYYRVTTHCGLGPNCYGLGFVFPP